MPWQYGPFTGRWDDPEQHGYRVIYSGTSPFACYAEVLASFRADPVLADEVAQITPDPRDNSYPSAHTGTVPRSWFGPRLFAQAELEGTYVDVQHATSIAIYRGPSTDRAGVDDARRRFTLATLVLAHRRGEALGDAFPGAVPRPFEVVAVHRVPS